MKLSYIRVVLYSEPIKDITTDASILDLSQYLVMGDVDKEILDTICNKQDYRLFFGDIFQGNILSYMEIEVKKVEQENGLIEWNFGKIFD